MEDQEGRRCERGHPGRVADQVAGVRPRWTASGSERSRSETGGGERLPLPRLVFGFGAKRVVAAAAEIPDLDEPLRTDAKAPHGDAVVIGIQDYLRIPDVALRQARCPGDA